MLYWGSFIDLSSLLLVQKDHPRAAFWRYTCCVDYLDNMCIYVIDVCVAWVEQGSWCVISAFT